jgi:hypothetical protein
MVREGHIQSIEASSTFLTCIVTRLLSAPSASELLLLALAGELRPLASAIQLLPLVQLSPLSLPSSSASAPLLDGALSSPSWPVLSTRPNFKPSP